MKFSVGNYKSISIEVLRFLFPLQFHVCMHVCV